MDHIINHDQVNQPGENDKVFFYPKEFYVFDNFSSFQVEWKDRLWPTSEHAYQAARFMEVDEEIVEKIRNARSAHDAQKMAFENKDKQRSSWDEEKFNVMREVLREKIKQHPYVQKKLIETGDREIIEDSWRDGVWGWGKDKQGENRLGKLWMELREEMKLTLP